MDFTTLIGKTVTFSVFPTALYGNSIQRVKILAVGGFDVATAFEDAAAMHTAVYPTLPVSVADDPMSYPWIVYADASGNRRIFGIPWIKDDTVIEVSINGTANIVVPNVTVADVERLRGILAANNFANVKINFV